MLTDNSIHLIHTAQPRHEHAPSTPGPTSKTRSAGCAPSTGPSQAHRYLPDNAPATTPCGSAAKSPTAATANSPTRTGGYAANSRAALANSAPTPGDTMNRRIAIGNDRAVLTANRYLSPGGHGHPPRHKPEGAQRIYAPSAPDNHRIPQCPLPACNSRQRAFPDRTGRDAVPLPRDPFPRPTGRGKARWAMRWKRPDHPDRQLTHAKVGSAVNRILLEEAEEPL